MNHWQYSHARTEQVVEQPYRVFLKREVLNVLLIIDNAQKSNEL